MLDAVSGAGSRYGYYSRAGKIVYGNDDRAGRKSSYVYLGGALVARHLGEPRAGGLYFGRCYVPSDIERNVARRADIEIVSAGGLRAK